MTLAFAGSLLTPGSRKCMDKTSVRAPTRAEWALKPEQEKVALLFYPGSLRERKYSLLLPATSITISDPPGYYTCRVVAAAVVPSCAEWAAGKEQALNSVSSAVLHTP